MSTKSFLWFLFPAYKIVFVLRWCCFPVWYEKDGLLRSDAMSYLLSTSSLCYFTEYLPGGYHTVPGRYGMIPRVRTFRFHYIFSSLPFRIYFLNLVRIDFFTNFLKLSFLFTFGTTATIVLFN